MHMITMTDAGLAAQAAEIAAEQRRRRSACPTCGGHMAPWMQHVCGPGGGTNIALDSAEARAITRAA